MKNLLLYNPLESKIKFENLKLRDTIDKFWKCFDESMQMNKRGYDGKIRILSIIADKFGHREIQGKLRVYSKFLKIIFLIDVFLTHFNKIIKIYYCIIA